MSELKALLKKRANLCESHVTLDGKPARISGYRNQFATVTQKDSGLSAEWSWEAVERIVAKGGKFQS